MKRKRRKEVKWKRSSVARQGGEVSKDKREEEIIRKRWEKERETREIKR